MKSDSSLKKAINFIQINPSFTKKQLLTQTGISVYQVEDILDYLIENYQCKLLISKDDELIYFFDISKEIKYFERIDKLKRLAINFLKTFYIFLLIGIVFFLIFYYFPILISFLPIIIKIAIICYFPFIFCLVIYALIQDYTKYKLNIGLKRFIEGKREFVYGRDKIHYNIFKTFYYFLFGNKRKSISYQDLEKRILSYISSNNNTITISEIAAITGWSIHKAETEAPKLMLKFDGSVKVDENGYLVYHFPELTTDNNQNISMLLIWNNLIPVKDWNKNYSFENLVIFSSLIFILFFSFSLYLLSYKEQFVFLNTFSFNIHLSAFIFSVILLISFIIGKIRHRLNTYRIINKNRHYLALRHIFSKPEHILLPHNNAILRNIGVELQAEYNPNEKGDVYMHFFKIHLETIHRDFSLYPTSIPYIPSNNKNNFRRLGKKIYLRNKEDGFTIIMKSSLNFSDRFNSVFFTGFFLFSFFPYIDSSVSNSYIFGMLPIQLTLFLLQLKVISLHLNSTIIDLSNHYCSIKSGPFRLFGTNINFRLSELNAVFSQPDNDYLSKFLIGIKNKRFALLISRRHKEKNILLELENKIWSHYNSYNSL